jgi:hypothetical protein
MALSTPSSQRPGDGSVGCDRDRAVVHAMFVDNLSAEQISDRLGVPEPCVAGIVRRTCDRLLAALGGSAAACPQAADARGTDGPAPHPVTLREAPRG